MKKLTQLDLFTGLGAFSLAFEREGFTPIQQVEIDKNCLKLLEAKWPDVPRHNDVTTFDPDSLAECPTIVTFGSPCQDLSVAGVRAGMAGERSGLFYHATRIIRRLVGRGLEFALWENVEGAFSSNGGRDFAGVLAELGRCGALDIGYRVLDCQFWGLAQRRRRVFLVADFRGQRCAEILSFAACLLGHPETSRKAGEKVAPTVEGVSNGGGANGPERDVDSYESLVPMTANRIGSHHPRTDLDNDTYVPTVARAVTSERDGYNDGSDRTYICMPSGQANAEHVKDGSPSLTCLHEAPIVVGYVSPRAIRNSDTANEVGIKDGQVHDCLQSDGPGAIYFQSRIARNGHGVPQRVDNTLQASATGDSKLLIAFDTTQITSKGNYSNLEAGDACHPLAAKGHAPAIANTNFLPQRVCVHDADGVAPALQSEQGRGHGVPTVAFQSSQSGVRQVDKAPTLDSHNGSRRQNGIAGNFGVRRLTPTECERLMGLPDGWTKHFHSGGHSHIICPCELFADLKIAEGQSLIVSGESVSCTTRDSKYTELTISRQSLTKQFTSARSVQGRLERMEQGDSVLGITNLGNVTETHFDRTGIWLRSERSNADDLRFTSQSLRLKLVEGYSLENLSTILTWMSAMIALKIFTFAQPEPITCRCMIHWSEPLQNSSTRMEELYSSVVGIGLFSDSVRYHMIGNSAAVPVIQWLAKAIKQTPK